MPIYEYKCAECGTRVERMQKISDEPLTVCETCGGQLEKQWSLSGFQFKGAGWYVTDYSNRTKETAATDKSETPGAKTENSEKTSGVESTTAPEGASNKTNDGAVADAPKKETVAKKD
jgi:putative FmdB family regulatory protein